MLHYEVVTQMIEKFFGKDPDITFLEIGVYTGIMENSLHEKFPNMKFIAIDIASNPFPNDFDGKLRFINKKSDDAIEDLKDVQIDFLYIDGDHNYEPCLSDIRNYTKLVKKRGIIAGHDYCKNRPAVRKPVDDTFGEVSYGQDLVWYFVKDTLDIEGNVESQFNKNYEGL